MTDNTHAQPVDLAPCPFCGKSYFMTGRGLGGKAKIACTSCEATGPVGRDGEASAVKAWNARLTSADPHGALDRLKSITENLSHSRLGSDQGHAANLRDIIAELEAARRPSPEIVAVPVVGVARKIDERRDQINALGGYQRLFDAIAAAVKPWPSKDSFTGISVSVFDFIAALQPPAPETEGDWVKAAAPFVDHYEAWMDEWPDEAFASTYARVTFGQLRALRAMLSKAPSPPLVGDLGGLSQSQTSADAQERSPGSQQSDGWRDISIAPKNSPILAFGLLDPHENSRELYAYLDRPRLCVCAWDEIDEAWSPVGGTWVGPWFKPTHWMPLPEAPATPDLTAPAPRHDDGGTV